jgi:lipase
MDDLEPLPVVLLHGLIGSLDDPAIAAALHPRLVFSPSLLGYGANADTAPVTITLANQVEYVAQLVRTKFGDGRFHLVGHSVGGVVAALFANKYPEMVASLITAEGNFTLRDAFWSASVARLNQTEAEAMLDALRIDPEGWLAQSGISPTEEHVSAARRWLYLQPASTLRAMGRSIVETTGQPSYDALLRSVFVRMPVHLIAGERSRDGWDVPAWAEELAVSFDVIEGAGHMMMLDDVNGFGQLLLRIIKTTAPLPFVKADRYTR